MTASGRHKLRNMGCASRLSASCYAWWPGTLAAAVLGSVVLQSVAQTNTTGCDATCQGRQLAAVQSLYSAVGATQSTLSAAAAQTPAHCSWYGITCCSSNITFALLVGSTDLVATSCETPQGVTAISLPSSNLTGSLPGPVWAALTSSLEYLDLSGES